MTVCMTIGRGVSQHVNAYLRDWINREWIGKGRAQKELADDLGVTKTTISDFMGSKRGAGYELFTGIARKIGRSREDVEREALVWWRAQGHEVGATKKDPYPNRTAALEFLRAEVPAEVARRIRTISLDTTGDPSRPWWVARIMSEMDLYRVQKP
jgi:transcriptional regulator with XRE-family HTH domain